MLNIIRMKFKNRVQKVPKRNIKCKIRAYTNNKNIQSINI